MKLLPSGVRVRMRPGQRLLDVLDSEEKPVFRTACRAGNCGACRLIVLQNAGDLRPPSAREYTTLLQLRAAPEERLGCQLVLQGDPPDDIVLQIVRPGP
ncbi:MAG: 2Fe-2S iron-sulfur cluster-binding protein [Polyangiales bacterium]